MAVSLSTKMVSVLMQKHTHTSYSITSSLHNQAKTFLLPLSTICPLRIKCSPAAMPCHIHSLYFQCPEYIHDPRHSPQSTHLSSMLPGVTPQSLRLRPRGPLLCPRSLSAGCSILPNNHGVHLDLLQLPPKSCVMQTLLWRKYTWMSFSTHTCIHICMQ